MYRHDALEALPIVIGTLDAILEWAPARGREGATLRNRAGIIRANAERLLYYDVLGEPMSELFDMAFDLGINLMQIDSITRTINVFKPVKVGALVIKHCLVQLTLAITGRIIANMDFRSRNDVEEVQALVNDRFGILAEEIADRMDAMSYRAVVELHAAISFYLVETARPRPRMMNFRFIQVFSTLGMSHRLYADASRADELRYENKVVHPAFARPFGRALAG